MNIQNYSLSKINNIAAITIFTCLTFSSCQQVNDNNRAPLPAKIKSGKLTTHINIPGTRIYIIPPKGFHLSKTFPGFKKDNLTTIVALDMAGTAFKNGVTFSKDLIEQTGYKVLEVKDLTVNGLPGKMAFVKGDGISRTYILVFGDANFSAMVQGSYNCTDRAMGEQVRQSLMSVYYDVSKAQTLYAPAIFSLDDSKSVFKYTKSKDGMHLYTLNAKTPNENEPYVVAFNVLLEDLTMEEAANKLVLIPGNYNLGNIEEGSTHGYPSLSRELFGELNGKNVIIYQHTVLIDETVVCMQCVAGEDDYEKYLREFKKLTNTVSKKVK